ncbi:MAG: histidinol-phosphatase HisJ family protein [Clostridia bacterium]|nr:histidinol-phosphatase HisJ family protein [Clostridia bacterium]
MIDYHIHTKISPDAEQALGDVVNKAREIGITHIAITDHYEFMDGVFYDRWKIRDLEKYGREIDEYNKKYTDIYIAKGIEIGHINRKKDEISKVLDTIEFDFIIDSAHFVDEVDPYYPEYYVGKTKEQAYYDYLREILGSIDYMDDRVSVIGHIGYAARYSPYEDYRLRYEDYKDVIDELLIKAVKRGIGIEINTSNFGRQRDEVMPPVSIIKRYRQLGGEIITIGSDAHRVNDIGKGFEVARQIALEAGFKYISIFKNLKEEKIPL